jgi:hypothetical protein
MDAKNKVAGADNRKELQYFSGLSGQFQEDRPQQTEMETVMTMKRKQAKPNKNVQCCHCGLMGHSRNTSKSTETMRNKKCSNTKVEHVYGSYLKA